MTQDEAQRRRWTFYEAVKLDGFVKSRHPDENRGPGIS
jgi:hypothetical protein